MTVRRVRVRLSGLGSASRPRKRPVMRKHFLFFVFGVTFRCAGLRSLLVGGNSNNGTNAGAVNRNSNNGPSNANTNIGSQLSFTLDETLSLPLGKK